VTAHLIQVADQTPLWSGTYEQALRSILALQRELAADIGREIRLKLAPRREAGRGGQETVNPDAYDAHLQGRQLLYGFTPQSVRRSVRFFKRAVELDPTYAAAYASLAEAYEQLPTWADQPSAATLPLALKAAQQALQLDPNLPEAYASLGLIDTYYSWDWASAERHFQKALSLNPGCSPARQWYAEFLAEMGRIDEALETIERAQRHDPLSRSIQATRAFVLLLGRRYDEAIAQAKRVLDLDPTYPMALIRLGIAYTGKGMNDAAVRTFQQAREAAPELLDCTALLAYANALAGNRREASQQLNQLRRRARQRYVPPFLFANICVAQGDYDRALHFIEEEYRSRGWYLLLIRHSPQFAPLQSHPRYKRLIRWMKFPG
jgi:tetratricopeptide (TPR) repeat protein